MNRSVANRMPQGFIEKFYKIVLDRTGGRLPTEDEIRHYSRALTYWYKTKVNSHINFAESYMTIVNYMIEGNASETVATPTRRTVSPKKPVSLNNILFGEYNKWYDALRMEANEDEDEDAPSADERFVHLASKILKRKGYSNPENEVYNWLDEMRVHDHIPSY